MLMLRISKCFIFDYYFKKNSFAAGITSLLYKRQHCYLCSTVFSSYVSKLYYFLYNDMYNNVITIQRLKILNFEHFFSTT